MKSRKLVWIVMVLFLSACRSTGVSEEPSAGEIDSLRIVMSYRPDVQFAPFYVAESRGYFQDNGLDVEFQHLPESESVQLVGADELQFAIVSGEQVLLARAQGLPVVYVMAWWQDYPIAIAAPAGGDIAAPADLVGKRIGFPGFYGASYIGVRALLSANGISEDDVTLDPIGFTQAEALYEGTVDAAVVYTNNEPVQLEAQDFAVVVFPVADYVRLPSNGLITNEKTLAEDPDLVRRMTGAILLGVEDAVEDPEGAFEISKDYVEGLAQADETVQRKVLEASILFWTTDRPGYSEAEAWENMQSILLEMEFLSEPLDLSQVYSNDYLP